MNNKRKIACYMRVATKEQLTERKEVLNTYAKKQGYAITDFVIEQNSGMAPYGAGLNELLHNQSVRTILVPNISGLSRKILELQSIKRAAKQQQKNIISIDGSYEKFPLD